MLLLALPTSSREIIRCYSRRDISADADQTLREKRERLMDIVRGQILVNVTESEWLYEKNGGETLRASVHDAVNGRENRRWKCQQREQWRGGLSADPPQRKWHDG